MALRWSVRIGLCVAISVCALVVGCDGDDEPTEEETRQRDETWLRAMAASRGLSAPASAPPESACPEEEPEGWIAGQAAWIEAAPPPPLNTRLCGGRDSEGVRALRYVSAGTPDAVYSAWETVMLNAGMTVEPWDRDAAERAFDFGDGQVRGFVIVDDDEGAVVSTVRWPLAGG